MGSNPKPIQSSGAALPTPSVPHRNDPKPAKQTPPADASPRFPEKSLSGISKHAALNRRVPGFACSKAARKQMAVFNGKPCGTLRTSQVNQL